MDAPEASAEAKRAKQARPKRDGGRIHVASVYEAEHRSRLAAGQGGGVAEGRVGEERSRGASGPPGGKPCRKAEVGERTGVRRQEAAAQAAGPTLDVGPDAVQAASAGACLLPSWG